MKKFSKTAAAISLGLACALPVMAQDTSTSTTAGSNTAQMGAGENMSDDNDRDMGWIGLLGLAGLLGLRRKHHDNDRREFRTDTRNPNTNVR